MTMGTEWDELSIPYTNPANSEIAMDRAADRYRYILERRVIEEPARRWIYSGGATALLARIIADGTGKPLHDFAREALFDPLGLGPTAWDADAKGEAVAASGLRMTPRDLARIGMMMAGGGMAGDRRIVPAPWIARSTEPVVAVDFWRFGYHWYVGDVAFGPRLAPLLGRLRQRRPTAVGAPRPADRRRRHRRQLRHHRPVASANPRAVRGGAGEPRVTVSGPESGGPTPPYLSFSSASAFPCVSFAMSAGASEMRSRKARPLAWGE